MRLSLELLVVRIVHDRVRALIVLLCSTSAIADVSMPLPHPKDVDAVLTKCEQAVEKARRSLARGDKRLARAHVTREADGLTLALPETMPDIGGGEFVGDAYRFELRTHCPTGEDQHGFGCSTDCGGCYDAVHRGSYHVHIETNNCGATERQERAFRERIKRAILSCIPPNPQGEGYLCAWDEWDCE
jgi:hypothetical protein